MDKNKIKDFVKSCSPHYIDVEFVGHWHSFDVYRVIRNYDKRLHLGPPIILFVNDEDIRFATYDELWDMYDDLTGCQNE